ncbi:hypothetical protein HMPREF1316_1167 [Olsenella profusa F0195]|uniref:Uncharacterized protein n=1 Tax=Olsenella profusa F0195 TaxID=1125712 RepID=U2TJK7_9ACTN|nr:hypothetical protein HMPREF1316_1167 [Olsenella profusa F0195]
MLGCVPTARWRHPRATKAQDRGPRGRWVAPDSPTNPPCASMSARTWGPFAPMPPSRGSNVALIYRHGCPSRVPGGPPGAQGWELCAPRTPLCRKPVPERGRGV